MSPTIIPITDFIRKFGSYADQLPMLEELILTRDGRPFATVKATAQEKNREFLRFFGAWKGTPLDSDSFWKTVRTRRNRTKQVVF